MTHDTTDATFDQDISTGTVLVDFWAPWCGPCKQLAPVLNVISQDGAVGKVLKYNIDENEKAAQYQVRSIPTLVLFNNGKEVSRKTGAMSLQQLSAWLEQNQPSAKQTEATELEFLKYFFQEADFGPADGDVRQIIEEQFTIDTGKSVPEKYRYE